MLVLKAQDIEFCQLFEDRVSQKTYPGIRYRGLLFVLVDRFSKTQLDIALKRCR